MPMSRLLTYVLTVGLMAAVLRVNAAEEQVSPVTVPGAMTVDAAAAKVLFDQGAVFVDTRTDADWEAGRIPAAVHLELKKVLSEAMLSTVVQKDQAMVFYCNGPKCMRSSEGAAMAAAWGFTKVYYFREGYPAWKAAGYAIE